MAQYEPKKHQSVNMACFKSITIEELEKGLNENVDRLTKEKIIVIKHEFLKI